MGCVVLRTSPFAIAPAMPEPFQPYLESICVTYAQWWQLYTLTDAAGKAQQAKQTAPTFDFGLMVQAIAPQKPGMERGDSSDRPEKIERFGVLEGLRKYADRHVLLVGRPGSGKSTALARLMLEEATLQTSEVLETSEVSGSRVLRIPLLVELRYWQGSIAQIILNTLAWYGLPLPPEQLETLLARSLILFDGVNELPSEEARSQLMAFRRDHPKVPMIFTTRDLGLGGDLGIEQKLEMQPLTEAQMQAFVRAYVPEQAEALLRQLKDRLRELGQTPLLLRMLCSLFQQTGTIPENLGLVFRLFTQGYEQRLKQDVVSESARAWWQPVLQQLAWVMMQGAQPTELRVEIAKKEAVGAISQFLDGKVPYPKDFARKCLRDLQAYHLVQAGVGWEDLEFRDQITYEYYVAEALLERLSGLSDEELQQEYLNYLKWTEPMALMLALVESEAQALRVVRLALAVDYPMGARLAGQVRPEFQPLTAECVMTLGLPEWLNVEALGWMKTDTAIEKLLEFLESQDLIIFRRAFSVLEKINPDLALQKFRETIASSDPLKLFSAGEMIGKIGFEKAMAELNDFISEPVFSIQWKSKDTSKMSSEDSLNVMLRAIENGTPDIRWKAAFVLGEIGSEKAVQSLNKAVRDPDFLVRWNATNALGRIKSPDSIQGLLIALTDDDLLIRGKAAEALGEGYFEEAVSELLAALEDRAFIVRQKAAEALGILRSNQAISGLLQLISHSDAWVSKTAASLLSQISIREDEAINLLPKLHKLLVEDSCEFALIALYGVQSWCRFYNHRFIQLLPEQHNMLNKSKSLKLFFSYAHEDELLRDRIAAHLSLLKRQGIIDTWHDRDITAGTDWAAAIDTNLNRADIILLLISANFLASDYCYDQELSRALDRHTQGSARVIPILLKPCDWETAPFGKLQALPIAHGAGAKPVTQWDNQDEAFAAIAKGIRQAAAEIQSQLSDPAHRQTAHPQPAPAPGTTIHVSGDYIAGDKVQGDKIAGNKTEFPNATAVKIFEQVENYHETPPPNQDPPS
jgi:HEAT repeat protein